MALKPSDNLERILGMLEVRIHTQSSLHTVPHMHPGSQKRRSKRINSTGAL